MNTRSIRSVAALTIAGMALVLTAGAADTATGPATTSSAPAVAPKALSKNVDSGLAWLAKHQLESGAWGQGEESKDMGGGTALKDTASVGDTCMALLGLMRAGNTPENGAYSKNVQAGIKYICDQVDKSDTDGLAINNTTGTRIQSKLGQYIDTFMACTMLADAQERTTNKELLKTITASLEKVVKKIEKNQTAKGTWGREGWAQALEQQMAVKGLNMAARNGNKVDEKVLQKAVEESQGRYDAGKKSFSRDGTAGVDLYGVSSSLGGQTENYRTDQMKKSELKEKLATAKPAEKEAIQKDLGRIADNEAKYHATSQAVAAKLDDAQFLSGFGSNGGEEFLSYMTIGESLVGRAGDEWTKWDKKMTENMNRIQNQDGSWSGQHCITGRTFCTSAALLVLMVDRTPAPIAAKIGKRQ